MRAYSSHNKTNKPTLRLGLANQTKRRSAFAIVLNQDSTNIYISPFIISKIIFKNRITNSIKQPPKTKVYPFFHRYLLLIAQSFLSMITSFRLMITSFSSTMQRFRSTIQSFSSTTQSFSSTIQRFSSTIQSFGSMTQSFGSTIQSFRSTTTSFASMITSFASTTTSLGRNNEIFLDTILKMCHIQIVKFIEKKGSLFGQRLLFLNKSY